LLDKGADVAEEKRKREGFPPAIGNCTGAMITGRGVGEKKSWVVGPDVSLWASGGTANGT